MNPNCVRKPEQIKLIMECRQSGLSMISLICSGFLTQLGFIMIAPLKVE